MQNEKWGVAKVKGIEPEEFFIFLMKADGPRRPLMRMSDFFTEVELRSELATKGSTEPEIDNLIERARSSPV
jgi:hypothetical protein